MAHSPLKCTQCGVIIAHSVAVYKKIGQLQYRKEGLSDQCRSGVEIVDGGGPQVVWIVSLCHLLG